MYSLFSMNKHVSIFLFVHSALSSFSELELSTTVAMATSTGPVLRATLWHRLRRRDVVTKSQLLWKL